MTRLTNYVILSYCILTETEDTLSAKGTNTIAVMSGSECYDSLKTGFKECWDEINQVIDDGQLEISPGHNIPIEVFLGGDYKFLLLVSGRSAANSNYACLWCKIHKDRRWDMSVPYDTYSKPPMSLTLDDIKKFSKKGEFCCVESPLLNVPLDHIILDELHLLLRFTDVLLSNLLEDAMELDDKDDYTKKRGEPKGIHLRKLTQLINSCGITFSVWEKKDGDGKGMGKMDWTSLMGDEKKKLLRMLPIKLTESNDAIHSDSKDTVVKLWMDFSDIYFNCISSRNPTDKESYGVRIRNWISLYLTLGNTRKGYGNRNVTPYMHAAAYHLQDSLHKFDNVKQFSGQGVEKNNDTARSIVLRKSNNWDSPAEVIRAEHRMQSLCYRERRKRNYSKKNSEFWTNGKRALATEAKKKCISCQHDDVPISVMDTPNNQQLSKKAQSKKKKTTTKRKANSASRRKK
ncbi:uncharacterized protein [Montipora capricornis]|uniref:uncharacterized protein n=1 Tax=Montipora capricornis TaxID=246305 RepID=UPI0035F1ADE4